MTDIGNCVECGKEVNFTRTGKHCNECLMEKAGAMRTMLSKRIYATTFPPQSIYEYITHRAFIPYIWNIPGEE